MADEPKLPYVRFEFRAVEDRAASIEAGHMQYRDVVFAIITPAGTKDIIEKPVEDWLLSLDEGVKQERIPARWYTEYKAAYERFKLTQENPEFGTPIKSWPLVTPAQSAAILAANIRTIEDLADANEEAVMRIGMGGRALKEKARAWLDSAKDTGATAAELDSLRTKNAELEARDTERQAQFEAMERRLKALEKTEEEA
jgi:hypothetical protein